MQKQESNNKLKKGLSYISERTNQLRYSDKERNEQWLSPLSTYLPLCEIKRGQPVSVAVEEDFNFYCGVNSAAKFMKDDNTYVVPTNPSVHTAAIGLALEYVDNPIILNPEDKTSTYAEGVQPIHLLKDSKFTFDPSYFKKTSNDAAFNEAINKKEYIPDFLLNAENIGKPVYVRGIERNEQQQNDRSDDGQLTVDPKEAYLAYNQIIQIGYVTDTFTSPNDDKSTKLEISEASIELQIEGDTRGPIDHTQFEAIIGEPVNILSTHYWRAFALGQEDETKFKFELGFTPTDTIPTIPHEFIAIRALDGRTAFVKFQSDENPLSYSSTEGIQSLYTDTSDRAFLGVSQFYKQENLTDWVDTVINVKAPISKKNIDACWTETKAALSTAFSKVAKEGFSIPEIKSLGIKANQYEYTKPTKLDVVAGSEGSGFEEKTQKIITKYAAFESDEFGGEYEIYISSGLKKYFELMHLYSAGSYYNKGLAVLADIRNPNRQNLLGVYSGEIFGDDGHLNVGQNAIFTHLGLLTNRSDIKFSSEDIGVPLYLGSLGHLVKIPQSYYNSVVKIGVIKDLDTLMVCCDDPREFYKGELPLGYMKPAVNNGAEYGFFLMDGETPHSKDTYADLYNFLLSVGCCEEYKDDPSKFVIKKAVYAKDFSGHKDVLAQIKAVVSGVYRGDPPHPFIKREYPDGGFLKATEENGGHPKIDITKIVAGYGVLNNYISIPSEADINVRVFVDVRKNAKDLKSGRQWTEIQPGFHLFNNTEYYGYEWKVKHVNDATTLLNNYPYGKWTIDFSFNGNFANEIENQDGRGLMYERSPFSPPVDVSENPLLIVVSKHDLWERQFDVESVFENSVDQKLVSVDGKPTIDAVSGQAVSDYIHDGIVTKSLLVDPEDGTTEKFEFNTDVKNFKIRDLAEENPVGLLIQGGVTFSPTTIPADLPAFATVTDKGVLSIRKWDEATHTSSEINSATTEEATDNFAKLKVYSEDHQGILVPYALLKRHESLDCHKLKDGYIDAKSILQCPAGAPNYIYSPNQRPPVGSLIPILKSNNTDFELNIGNKVIHQLFNPLTTDAGNYDIVKTDSIALVNNKLVSSEKLGSTVGSTYEERIIKSGDKVYSKIYDFEGGTVSESINGSKVVLEAPSTIQLKAITKELLPDNIVTEKGKGFVSTLNDFLEKEVKGRETQHTDNGTSSALMKNALQAVSVIPTAKFHYLDEDDQVKRWFGIITERIGEVRTSINDGTDIHSQVTTLNKISDPENRTKDVLYNFTDSEKESIVEYLTMITGEKEKSQNVLSTVGLLVQASKETQDRLLKLETSTFGDDAPDAPGYEEREKLDNKVPKMISQSSTYLGLNRLVKALCAEVFLDADPDNLLPDEGEDPGKWQDYSRVDLIIKRIFGEAAEGNGSNGFQLLSDLGTSYPSRETVNQNLLEFVPRKESYNTSHSPIEFPTEENEDYRHKTDAVKPEDNIENTIVEGITDKREEEITKGTAPRQPFDGIHDAVNRIAKKLNILTEEVNDEDNIGSGPKALDRIRTNIETLIREVFEKTYSDDFTKDASGKHPAEQFKKGGESRIDALSNNLYSHSFDLLTPQRLFMENADSTRITRAGRNYYESERDFNGKPLLGYFDTETDASQRTGKYHLKTPEFMGELEKYGSMVDVIFDAISGNDTFNSIDGDVNIIRNSYVESEDKDLDLPTKRVAKNILHRLNSIERQLDLVTQRATNTAVAFEQIEEKTDGYEDIKDIDTFVNFIRYFYGIYFDNSGDIVKDRMWKKSSDDDIIPDDVFTDIDSGDPIEGLNGADKKPGVGGIHLLTRVQKALKIALTETGIKAECEKVFGTEYMTDDGFAIRLNDEPDVKYRSMSSDLGSLMKLFYGKNTLNGTEITHKADNNDFTSEVVNKLWYELNKLPARYNYNDNTAGTDNNVVTIVAPNSVQHQNDVSATTRYIYSDTYRNNKPAGSNPAFTNDYDYRKLHLKKNDVDPEQSNTLKNILDNGNRDDIFRNEENSFRKNRFDVIEENLRGLRKIVIGDFNIPEGPDARRIVSNGAVANDEKDKFKVNFEYTEKTSDRTFADDPSCHFINENLDDFIKGKTFIAAGKQVTFYHNDKVEIEISNGGTAIYSIVLDGTRKENEIWTYTCNKESGDSSFIATCIMQLSAIYNSQNVGEILLKIGGSSGAMFDGEYKGFKIDVPNTYKVNSLGRIPYNFTSNDQVVPEIKGGTDLAVRAFNMVNELYAKVETIEGLVTSTIDGLNESLKKIEDKLNI